LVEGKVVDPEVEDKEEEVKRLPITEADKCANEEEGCTCVGVVYYGTWKSMMIDEKP